MLNEVNSVCSIFICTYFDHVHLVKLANLATSEKYFSVFVKNDLLMV